MLEMFTGCSKTFNPALSSAYTSSHLTKTKSLHLIFNNSLQKINSFRFKGNPFFKSDLNNQINRSLLRDFVLKKPNIISKRCPVRRTHRGNLRKLVCLLVRKTNFRSYFQNRHVNLCNLSQPRSKRILLLTIILHSVSSNGLFMFKRFTRSKQQNVKSRDTRRQKSRLHSPLKKQPNIKAKKRVQQRDTPEERVCELQCRRSAANKAAVEQELPRLETAQRWRACQRHQKGVDPLAFLWKKIDLKELSRTIETKLTATAWIWHYDK